MAKQRRDVVAALAEEKEAIALLNEMVIHISTYPSDASGCTFELAQIALRHYTERREDLERCFTALASRRLNRILKETSKRKRK